MMKLCLAVLLVAAVSCIEQYPQIPQPITSQQYPPIQQQQYYVPQYQQQQQQIPAYYPPQIVRPDSLDHDQMCKLVVESSNKMLYYLFGMQINPVDFSFLQCMHKSELVQLQKLMDSLKTLDMNFNALQIPGYGQVPRLPLLSCISEQVFQEIQVEVAKRPEQDKDWPLPPSCGRYDGQLNLQQCAALVDRVIPTLVIPGIPSKTIPWTDVSFLEQMGDEELCYIRKASKEQLQEAKDKEDTLLWNIIEIDPLQRLLPAFKCYLDYLVQNVDKKIASRGEGEEPEAYCEKVTDLLVSDVLDEVAGGRQVGQQRETRSVDTEKRGYRYPYYYPYCYPWYSNCGKSNKVKLRLKVNIGTKNQITNIWSSSNSNKNYNKVNVNTNV